MLMLLCLAKQIPPLKISQLLRGISLWVNSAKRHCIVLLSGRPIRHIVRITAKVTAANVIAWCVDEL
jgi:hypothetical protein